LQNWPYEALNSTYRAITGAGFNRANFPRLNDVMFITESEAAARYTVRHYKEEKAVEFLNVRLWPQLPMMKPVLTRLAGQLIFCAL